MVTTSRVLGLMTGSMSVSGCAREPNEGKPIGRREKLNASGYPQSPVAFFQFIDAWRKSGRFDGLAFRTAAKLRSAQASSRRSVGSWSIWGLR